MTNEPIFTDWRKSARSGGGDNCVEVGVAATGFIGIRDSKDPLGPVLVFAEIGWREFLAGAKSGEFDA